MGGTIYILAGNVHNWQVQHNVLHHTYTNIPGHDEDLDAGRIIRFTKDAKWHSFHRFQQYYSVFLYGLLTFNWAITTDFKQMRTYLKENYPMKEEPKTLWTTLIITKVIYVHLDRTTYYRYRLVESINRFLYHALHCRIDSEYRISIGTRCRRDR
jgi:linoleoyl-CoA desaturase